MDKDFAAMPQANRLGYAQNALKNIRQRRCRQSELLRATRASPAALHVAWRNRADFTMLLCDEQIGAQFVNQFSMEVIQGFACAEPSAHFRIDRPA
jgi:hypothetical protein